ncbi:MAG: nitroreductase family protein [Dehalococcoidia bacterium]|nr:nitroreductase family protein [Dehalococcoidia bacterium]
MRIKTFKFGLVAVVMLAGACATPPIPQEPAETPTLSQPSPSAEEPLSEPIITANSVELCLNSRYSEHSLTGTASNQQIANILWAAGKAPVTGSYRDTYVATPTGEYSYNPGTHSLSRHSDQLVTDGAFVINYESDLAFDTGVAYMLATLSSVSLWKSSESAVASCPKRTSLYFGVQEVRGLTSELVAHSSAPQGDPEWLPDPSTDGQNKLEEVLANLKYVSKFSAENLTLQQISQLLWAGYGCTPHVTSNGRMGLTVPSAQAKYYLTGTIYLANENGVYRYHNRNPSTDLTTRDHRIEPISSDDVRDGLRAAVSGLPQAPCYMVVCLGTTGTGIAQEQNWALLETGFVAGNILVQASALGLGCHFETTLTSDEQAAIRKVTGMPSSDTPQVVISIGGMAK